MAKSDSDIVHSGRGLEWFAIGCAVAMVGGLYTLQTQHGTASIWQLRFNAFALISLTGALVNLGFLGYVLSRRRNFTSSEVTWYVLILMTLILFAIFEMLQRLSATTAGALFWSQLEGIGPAFEPVGVFLFVLMYISPRGKHFLSAPIVILGGTLLFFFHVNGQIIFQATPAAMHLFPWGYNNPVAPGFALNVAWSILVPAAALIALEHFARQATDRLLARQARLFMIAFAIPLAGAIMTDLLPPLLSLHLPPLHVIFTTVTAAMMLYGLRRYRVFRLSPASIAPRILTTMSESVIATDQNLRIELMNRAAEELFRVSAQQVSTLTLPQLFSHDQAARIEQIISGTIYGDRTDLGSFAIHQPQGNVYARMTAAQIVDGGEAAGYVFAITDITALQQSYQSLAEEKHSVDRKVEQRTAELHAAQQRLAETDKIKTEFVLLTSHNLRTPLAVIQGTADILAHTELSEEQKHFVNNLQTSTKQLSGLVEELLTISSIQAGGQTVMRTVRLSSVLNPLIVEAKRLTAVNDNRFAAHLVANDIELRANLARLQTALHNLIDNACKFTQHGEITLTVTTASDGRSVDIAVADTGIGIAPAELPKLFTDFHRATSALQYNYEGEGIGLYLTKLIVEEHGGRIAARSQLGGGSVFTVTLPLPSQAVPFAATSDTQPAKVPARPDRASPQL